MASNIDRHVINILDLTNPNAELLQPIPVSLWPLKDGTGYLGQFEEAGICVQGESETAALERVTVVVLEWFDDLSRVEPDKLLPDTRRVLRILRRYLTKRRRKRAEEEPPA